MEAIYTRQSVDKLDSLSIESQIEQCKKFSSGDIEIYQDKGFSGKNTNRPAFQRLMEDVEAGKISKIYVYRLDRFSRSIADFGQVWKTLERCGVQFQSVTEQFDTSSPMGRAMLNIIMTFAQLERETTAERVKDNYRHRFSLGAWPGGPAPLGFSLTKVQDSSGRKVSALVKNEQASVIRDIFSAYAEDGATLGSVAKILNQRGIAAAKRKTWDNVALSRILHSPVYVRATEDIYWWYLSKGLSIQLPPEAFDGIHGCNLIGRRDRSRGKYQDLKDQLLTVSNHEGIIPAELWLHCQEKLEKNAQLHRGNAGKYSWLTGLMKCKSCGYAVKINRMDGRFYLVCSGRSNLSACSERIRVDLHELENAVAAQIQAMLKSCPAEEVYNDDSGANHALLQLDQKIDRLVAAMAESDDAPTAYIMKEIQRLDREKTQLIQQLKSSRKKPDRVQLDWDKLSFDEKKHVASEFVERILLHDDEATIIWKV